MSRWCASIAYLVALLPALAWWWWQGRPLQVVDAPATVIPCISYAPYRGDQTPFDEDLVIAPEQIEHDLRSLASITACVRTYAVNQGLEQVPRIAHDLGMKVMLGAWIGPERSKNEAQIERAIELARQFPETITTVIVGNEVLLRREQPPAELAAMIGRVGRAVPVPVTYADVWEFWQKHPEVADVVDFVTIHTLPYWEDEPRPIDQSVAHVEAIWRRIGAQFAGKPVLIGEAGWPSAGRMRKGALPSPVNQARFVRELIAAAARDDIGVNFIESFDQPWKRRLEGTVGGHWGLFDTDRKPKVALTGPVSDDPRWSRHFAIATVLGIVLLMPALFATDRLPASIWLGLTLAAIAAASALVAGLNQGLLGSRTIYDWLVLAVRWSAAAVAAALVLAALPRAAAGVDIRPLPMATLIDALRKRRLAQCPWPEMALGVTRAIALFGAAATTLCLVFDPRYRDFANELHAVPALAFAMLAIAPRRHRPGTPFTAPRAGSHMPAGMALAEEKMLGAILAVGGLLVALNEGFLNYQALGWTLLAMVFALAIFFDVPRNRAPMLYRRRKVSAPSSSPPAAGSGT